MKKLVGFIFISTQEEFEKWQKDNDEFVVHTVQPHLKTMGLDGIDGRYCDANPQWGVFVTYIYEEKEDEV